MTTRQSSAKKIVSAKTTFYLFCMIITLDSLLLFAIYFRALGGMLQIDCYCFISLLFCLYRLEKAY